MASSMQTPALTPEVAARQWERFGDEGGCDYTQEVVVADRACKGVQYLQEKSIDDERKAFDAVDECDGCQIAGTADQQYFQRVTEGLDQRMPCLLLHDINLKEVTPKTEVYLPTHEIFGTIVSLDEIKEECNLQVTAVGLDERGQETPFGSTNSNKVAGANQKHLVPT